MTPRTNFHTAVLSSGPTFPSHSGGREAETTPEPPAAARLGRLESAAGVGREERRHLGRDRAELLPGGWVPEQLPAMEAIEVAGEHLQALALGLDRLVHGPSLADRHIAVIGGDHEHRRHPEL